jgi:SAM-dependent methyltransferase
MPGGHPHEDGASALHAYEALAPLYDELTHDYPHERWVADMESLARRYGLAGRDLLDVACGTGKSTLPLARRGYRASGCDLSPGMVAVAARRLAPYGVRPVTADMRDLPWRECFDFVTCLDDAVNYLLTAADLAAAVQSMAQTMRTGGLLVFDTNTLCTYRTSFATEAVVEAPAAHFRWRGEAPGGVRPGVLVSASIEATAGGLGSPAGTSRHVQRHHPRADVERAIAAAGLGLVAVHGLLAGGEIDPFADEERHLKAIYFARRGAMHARREGGGAQMIVKPG